jgi:hypothetical protein
MTGEYKVIRSSKGTYVKGRYVPGPMKTIKVAGSMQPSSARELKLPEEGNRLKQFYKFFTDEPILTNSMATLSSPDIVTVNGDTFKAMAPINWQHTNIDYFMTIIWREPEQATDGDGAL